MTSPGEAARSGGSYVDGGRNEGDEMTVTTQTSFDFYAYRQAVEENDLSAQSAFFGDDTEYTLIDAQNPPGTPLVRRGRKEIASTLAEKSPEGLTHRIEDHVLDDRRAAYIERCSYPNGQQVVCHVLLDLRGGGIARARCVQA